MKGKTVTVVKRTEMGGFHEYDFKVFAFERHEKAEQWIDGQIADLVQHYGLVADQDVDGWFVQLDGLTHTVQFDAEECEVL